MKDGNSIIPECPYCGSSCGITITNYIPVQTSLTNGVYSIICNDCGLITPKMKSKKEALEAFYEYDDVERTKLVQTEDVEPNEFRRWLKSLLK